MDVLLRMMMVMMVVVAVVVQWEGVMSGTRIDTLLVLRITNR
jgi:hypothetical protein